MELSQTPSLTCCNFSEFLVPCPCPVTSPQPEKSKGTRMHRGQEGRGSPGCPRPELQLWEPGCRGVGRARPSPCGPHSDSQPGVSLHPSSSSRGRRGRVRRGAPAHGLLCFVLNLRLR